jgi:TrmH family RNA methyltransferase
MPADLTSTRSARVTEVRHLHDRRHRAERGAFVVEGPGAVEAAVSRGILELYATEQAAARHPALVEGALDSGGRVSIATDEVVQAMSETRQPQGLIAVCPLVTRSLAEVLAVGPTATPLVVVLDRIADPGNAGTIIRTADAMGATAIVLTEGSVDPHNGKCVRSTAGSIFHVPIAADVSTADILDAVSAAGIAVVAADADGGIALATPESVELLRGPVAWVFGNEAHGVHEDLAAAARESVRIRQSGGAESLNVAAAAAICLFETARVRGGGA